MASGTYRKQERAAPGGYSGWEAAGLRWLASAPGGAPVVRVLDLGSHHLDIERLDPVSPSDADADAFGAALARTHAAGAASYGAPPEGWSGDGWLGPAAELLPLSLRPVATWGELYARQRVEPMLQEGLRRGVYGATEAAVFQRLAARLVDGTFDTGEPASRIHGDLWSGNIVWTARGGVLIDPAAHGGHRETDLAFLRLFWTPHLDRLLAAYDEAVPLADGWRERVQLHQVHHLMLHAVLFRGGYVGQSVAAARRYL